MNDVHICKNEPLPPCPCNDCGVDTVAEIASEMYIVEQDVWQSSGASDDGILCIGCLERRIGRLLDADDFTGAPLNYSNAMGVRPVSARLLHRMFTPGRESNAFAEFVDEVHRAYTEGNREEGDDLMQPLALFCDCEGYPDYWYAFERTVRRGNLPSLRAVDD